MTEPVQGRDNGLSKNAQRQQQAELAELENRVHQAEDRLQRLSQALQQATVEQAFDKIQTLSIEYAEAQTRLEKLVHEWEKFASDTQ